MFKIKATDFSMQSFLLLEVDFGGANLLTLRKLPYNYPFQSCKISSEEITKKVILDHKTSKLINSISMSRYLLLFVLRLPHPSLFIVSTF